MRLKEIKPGMVIHCKNDEEKKALMEEAERLGYVWYYLKMKPTAKPIDQIGNTIHFYDANNHNGFTADYKHITHSAYKGGDVIEFSDLILPEMTADELLNILNEIIHCGVRRCDECHLAENGETLCTDDAGGVKISNPDKLISICQQWKSEHEKKEPEVEWVYRVFGEENYGEKFFNTEEEAIKRCEELVKSQKTKQYARYERVCRVKAVE